MRLSAAAADINSPLRKGSRTKALLFHRATQASVHSLNRALCIYSGHFTHKGVPPVLLLVIFIVTYCRSGVNRKSANNFHPMISTAEGDLFMTRGGLADTMNAL